MTLSGKAEPFRTSGGTAAKQMRDPEKTIDPLPDSFESEEAAGEFWDTHSLMDYQQFLEATDDTIEITERVFESAGCRRRVQETTAASSVTSSADAEGC